MEESVTAPAPKLDKPSAVLDLGTSQNSHGGVCHCPCSQAGQAKCCPGPGHQPEQPWRSLSLPLLPSWTSQVLSWTWAPARTAMEESVTAPAPKLDKPSAVLDL